MGQKVSTLRYFFGRKNTDADPSKNGGDRSATCTCASAGDDGVRSCCRCDGAPPPVTAGQQSQPTNAAVSCRDASTSAPPDDDDDKDDSQTPSKRASGTKKNGRWLLRFNCRRPKSKNVKSSEPPPPQPSAPTPPPPSPSPPVEDVAEPVPEPPGVSVDEMMDEDPPCVCLGYRRAADVGTSMVFDEDDDEYVPDVIAVPVDDDEDDDRYNEAASNDIMFGFHNSFDAFRSFEHHSRLVLPSFDGDMMDIHPDFHSDFIRRGGFLVDDMEDRAYRERAKEIQEGIEPPPGFRPGVHIQLLEFNLPNMTIDNLTSLFQRAAITAFNAPQDMDDAHRVHTSIDYIHYLVPDLLQITNCSFYWGKMDRYEAERLLENRPEGTFLLRDSAQEEYLFSVSFRKYGRSLHARIEQWNHMFSFDSRDPGVFASPTVCGLIEHYKDPTCCMFFEPMLTIPLNRNFTFSLLHMARATICNQITYDDVNQLKIPKALKSYLKEYHYKQRVRVRLFDTEN